MCPCKAMKEYRGVEVRLHGLSSEKERHYLSSMRIFMFIINAIILF